MTIPKIIHQIWVGNENPKPERLMQLWKDKHPDFVFQEWNEETIRKDFRLNKQIEEMYKAKRWHGVADLVRYEVIYKYGGFVAPADSECLNPIDDLLDLGCFACYENEEYNKELVSPHLGCCPGDKLIGEIIAVLEKKETVLEKEPWRETGNLFLTTMIKKLDYKEITILPSYTFIPKHRTGIEYKGDGKVYARHHWGTTKKIYSQL